jgi:alanine racemase
MPTRPVWAEISLDRLTANYRFLCQSAAAASFPSGPAPELLAVVKANAYGHGIDLCGPALAAAGARWLGVTSVEEGAALRRALGVLPSPLGSARILVMSSLWLGEADTVLDRALTPQVWEPYQFDLLLEAACNRNLGPASIPVHLEIDTGMARQGVAPGSALEVLLAQYCVAGSPLAIEGVMTHFRAPEMLAEPDTDQQLARFAAALDQLAAAGAQPKWIHAGNSATAVDPRHTAALATLASRYPASPGQPARLMLRPGLALYGYPTRFRSPVAAPAQAPHGPRLAAQRQSPQTPPEVFPAALPESISSDMIPDSIPDQSALQPVLSWKSRISSLRTLAPGEGAGYNSIFRATRPTRLALIPVGYADGLNRLLSNPVPSKTSAMLVRGQRAPIAGRVSMDQTILDVTDIPSTSIGDEVVILGSQGDATITAADHADLCNTIPYEILCDIAARVPRGVVD